MIEIQSIVELNVYLQKKIQNIGTKSFRIYPFLC